MHLHGYAIYASARSAYANAAKLDPLDHRWPHLLGRVHEKLGETEQAAEQYRKAVEIEPEDLAAWVYLGNLQLGNNELARSRASFERALALDPACPAARVGLGRLALLERDYLTARELFEAALAVAPYAGNIHFLLSETYRGLGDLEQAAAQLELRNPVKVGVPDELVDALSQRLTGVRALRERGVRLARSGRLEEAIIEFEAALELDARDAETIFYIGVARLKLGRLGPALEAFREAVRLDPVHDRAHLFLGSVAVQLGMDPEAARHLTRALELHPDLAAASLELAKVQQRSGRPEPAVRHYTHALERDPGNAEARLYRLLALIQLGRYGEAMRFVKEDLEILPDEPAFKHVLARLLAAAPDAALRDGPRALALTEQLRVSMLNTELAETIAMALAEVGRFEEAISWQRAALDRVGMDAGSWRSERLARMLRGYEQRLPCREPWSPDDPVFRPQRSRSQADYPLAEFFTK